jgi:predicted amidohydrolase
MDAQLIVLPEFFNTGYLFISWEEAYSLSEAVPGGTTTDALCNVAKKKGVHVVGGLIEREKEALYNAAVLVGPEGYIGKYRKVHLFSEENLYFTPGNLGLQVFDVGPYKIGIMICFDWMFPESARVLALKGADVICHCANLVMPYCQDAMVTRCLENHVYAVTANRTGSERRGNKFCKYTGGSQITGPLAKILYRADREQDETGTAVIDIAKARNKQLNRFNDLFTDRKPRYYHDLIK